MSRNALLAAAAATALAACQPVSDPSEPHAANGGPPAEGGESEVSVTAEERLRVVDAEDAAAPYPAPAPPSMAANGGRAMTGAVANQSGVIPPPAAQPLPGDVDRDRFPEEEPNPIQLVSEEPVSTFSVDVDTASYSIVRRSLNEGVLPPTQAVRIEEMVNYFQYDYPYPDSAQQPFSVNVDVAPSPWNEHAQLIRIGLQGYDIVPEERPRANLVFLLDVSGSMNAPDKLPLLQQSMRLLVNQLDDDDTVSIVVYAGAAGAVLEPTPGSERQRILAAIDSLSAGGSTAGGEGLRLAYALAEQNFDEDAVNRVILATDGDFNVGVATNSGLEDFVERRRESGIYLSVFGFGRGNYNDALMQTIAQAGNGTAAYIDSLNEARRVLHDEMQGALFPIANDVKIQVEFNPARVAEYRLIGYETRMLRREDFSNDEVDAGEIGSGHEVTAIYEIVPPGSDGRRIEPRRYGGEDEAQFDPNAEIAFVRVRYKYPGEDESVLLERPVTNADVVNSLDQADPEARWAYAVAGFGQLLREEPFLEGFDYDDVLTLAQSARGDDAFGYRAEFIQLVRLAETAAVMRAQTRPAQPGQ